MKIKTFDCVRMKDNIQKGIYDEIKNLTPEEQASYFRNSVQSSVQLQEKISRITQAK